MAEQRNYAERFALANMNAKPQGEKAAFYQEVLDALIAEALSVDNLNLEKVELNTQLQDEVAAKNAKQELLETEQGNHAATRGLLENAQTDIQAKNVQLETANEKLVTVEQERD